MDRLKPSVVWGQRWSRLSQRQQSVWVSQLIPFLWLVPHRVLGSSYTERRMHRTQCGRGDRVHGRASVPPVLPLNSLRLCLPRRGLADQAGLLLHRAAQSCQSAVLRLLRQGEPPGGLGWQVRGCPRPQGALIFSLPPPHISLASWTFLVLKSLRAPSLRPPSIRDPGGST